MLWGYSFVGLHMNVISMHIQVRWRRFGFDCADRFVRVVVVVDCVALALDRSRRWYPAHRERWICLH